MDFRRQEYDYPSLILKYVKNKELANRLQDNIDFVEKYVDCIDELFPLPKERHLMYKQLGIMVFSCTELLWKSLVYVINQKCEEKGCCNEKCSYRKFHNEKELKHTPINIIVEHLNNMRVISVVPDEMETIEKLQQMRNDIHFSFGKAGEELEKYDRQYVENMQRLYYVTLNQLELTKRWYLLEECACLRELDEDAYEQTEKQNKNERKRHVSDVISYMTSILLHEEEIPENKKDILKKLSFKDNYDEDSLVDYVGRWLYFEKAHFKSE